MRDYRYGPWDGGADPLAPPYDVRGALDEIGDAVLQGGSPRNALDRLLRNGVQGRRGLDDLMRQVRRRQREVRDRGRLDGTLEEVRRLLDTAVGQERAELFPRPTDDARLREQQLDGLPSDTSRAVQELAQYDWQSPQARQTFADLQDLLRREVLDSQFRGMKQALESATPEDLQRVKDMVADLNQLVEAHARGTDTPEQLADFLERHGDFFPERPETVEELIDSLARRAAAAQRMMASLTRQQREELAGLMAQAMQDIDLAAEMARLGDSLRAARPDLDWDGRTQRMQGDQPLGLGEATTALEELADLDALAEALGQDYPGASVDDIDPEAVRRALGRSAVDDVRALRELERELERQGLVRREQGQLELTPRAVKRIGATALSRVFADLGTRGRGDHDIRDAGGAGERTGSTRPWHFGDEQPIDVVATVRNAVLRSGRGPVRLQVDDFEVVETERRTSAAVVLLVDLSYSMALRGTWAIAKSTALALHTLATTAYPQDKVHIVGFSDYAREIRPVELAGLDYEMVQGTNLQHALIIANRLLGRYPDSEPVVLCITDGEPTAHLEPDGSPYFCWPPLPETLELTMAEVDRVTRRGATINVFMLDDDPRLVQFVELVAERNGGRVFSVDPDKLGQYVVRDYLRARSGRRATR